MATAMKYTVYRPTYKVAGRDHNTGEIYYEVVMQKVGKANTMEQAKRKFGGAPILGVE